MRSTGTDQLVRAMKAGHAAGAKGLGQAVVFNVQLATGGDLGGNEAVRHPEDADADRLPGGSGVSREAPAPFCERPEVKLLRPTRPLFAATKTRGFNLEDTHLVHPDRIGKLLAVLAVAFAFAHAIGEWQTKQRPIALKVHNRRAQSVFRLGFDLLRKTLLEANEAAVPCWRLLVAGRPLRPIPPHLSPQLKRLYAIKSLAGPGFGRRAVVR